MGLWGSRRDRALGRRLRDERPEPRPELVRLLSREIAPPKKRRVVPTLVFVAVLTALVAGSLGVTGAMASASHSVVTLSKSVYHVVVTPSHTTKDNRHGKGDDGDDDHGHDPFHHQYGHKVPICHNGHIISIPEHLYLWRILHGDKPAADCPPHHK